MRGTCFSNVALMKTKEERFLSLVERPFWKNCGMKVRWCILIQLSTVAFLRS